MIKLKLNNNKINLKHLKNKKSKYYIICKFNLYDVFLYRNFKNKTSNIYKIFKLSIFKNIFIKFRTFTNLFSACNTIINRNK